MSSKTILRTGKNATMLLAGTMTRMIASFVFVLYCADKMGVEGFGKYSIAIHYFELFLSLTATAAGILLTRDVARWPRQTRQLLTSAIMLCSAICLVGIAAMATVGTYSGYSGDTQIALSVASLALVPASICVLFEAVFVARERAEFVTAGIAIESLLRITLSVWLLFQGYGLVALLWVVFFVRCTLLVAYIAGLLRIGAIGWSLSRRRTLRFANRWRMFAAENWMASIYTNLDVIVLSWVSGEVAAGIYSAAWRIVRLGSVVAKSYTTAVFPVMSRMYAQSRESFSRLYRHTIRVMCALALPAIAVVSVLPGRVIAIFFSEEYAAAAPVLQVLIWVLLIEFLNPFLSHALFAQGRQDRSMWVAAISLAVNSIATYLLVLRFGAVGAALGTVIGGLVATCCYLLFALPKREVLATVVLASRVVVAAVGLGAVVYMVRESPWIELALISAVVYAPLLFLVGAVRIEDLRFFRTTFLVKAAACLISVVIFSPPIYAQSDSLSRPRWESWISTLSADQQASIVWRADHEEGDLSDWQPTDCQDPGGGVLNTGGKEATAIATTRQAHSGRYSAEATITGAVRATRGKRAVRLMRWTDRPWDKGGDYFPKSAFYSTWMFIPKTYNSNKYAPWDPGDGGWWNVFQFKADDENGDSQPTWTLNVDHDDDTTEMQFYLHSSINAPASVDQIDPVPIPVGRWFHLEALFQVDAGREGQIVVWQDGAEILRAENVRTAITTTNQHAVWGVGNYTDHITGDLREGTSTIYFDDAAVSTRRLFQPLRR